jgi:glycosyltransferase involved in cell wall biosynthesis
VIYNGIDYELFNPSKADGTAVRAKFGIGNDFIYMYYGRAGISKGLEYLIQAVPLISKDIPNSRLLLILGDEPKDRRKHIIEMISRLRIENQIILLRPVPKNELPGYIAASDCVVVPSLSEGFGFTAAEACAMEKPIVATDVASLPEVVSGKYVLVNPRSPEEIARAISKVYHGNAEQSPRKNFSWFDCVDNYLETYDELLKR